MKPHGNPKRFGVRRCAALFGITPRPKAAHSAALQDAGAPPWGGFKVPMQAQSRKGAFHG
jgi:hypothetical protein